MRLDRGSNSVSSSLIAMSVTWLILSVSIGSQVSPVIFSWT